LHAQYQERVKREAEEKARALAEVAFNAKKAADFKAQ